MTSDFVFFDVTRTFNVATLKPSNLARVFELDLATLELVDEEKILHLPENDGFDPPLGIGRTYNVSDKTTRAQEADVVTDLVPARNCQDLVKTTTDASKTMTVNINQVRHAPSVVLYMDSMVMISSLGPDLALVPPKNGFQHLHHPESLKACLHQVIRDMSQAFLTAHMGMDEIWIQLVDLPDELSQLTAILSSKTHQEYSVRFRTRFIERLGDRMKECLEVTERVRAVFTESIKATRELTEAVHATAGKNEGELKKTEKGQIELQSHMEVLKQMEETLHQNDLEQRARVEAARRLFEKQAARSPGIFETIVASCSDAWSWLFRSGGRDACPTEQQALRENLLKTAGMLKEEHETEKRRQEDLQKEKLEYEEETAKIKATIQNMDLTKVDFENVIKVLNEGIPLLEKAETNWNNMILFFRSVETSAKATATSGLKKLKTSLMDDAPFALVLDDILACTGLSMQMANHAQVYRTISEQYLLPMVNGIGKSYGLSLEEAQDKQSRMEATLQEIQEGIERVIKEGEKNFKDDVTERMLVYESTITKAVTPFNSKH